MTEDERVELEVLMRLLRVFVKPALVINRPYPTTPPYVTH